MRKCAGDKIEILNKQVFNCNTFGKRRLNYERREIGVLYVKPNFATIHSSAGARVGVFALVCECFCAKLSSLTYNSRRPFHSVTALRGWSSYHKLLLSVNFSDLKLNTFRLTVQIYLGVRDLYYSLR